VTKIEAVVRPHKLDDVKEALDDLGARGITVTSVLGAGKQRGAHNTTEARSTWSTFSTSAESRPWSATTWSRM